MDAQQQADTTRGCGPSLRYVQIATGLVFVWMLYPVVSGQVYVADDLLNYHLPIRSFYSECLKNGDDFDWMPSLFSGFFLTGTGQAGTWHPWHWMLYRFLPMETAFTLEIVSSYPLMFAGMLVLLRRHLERTEAVWLGAISFTFSGFCTLHFLHPNAIAVVAHIPWLLACLDRVMSPSASRQVVLRSEIAIALLTGSQLLLGYPQYVWYSLLAESVFCLSAWVSSGLSLRVLFRPTAMKLIGLGLGAVQLLPSMEALRESERTAMDAEYFNMSPLSLPDMLQWIGPYLTQSRVFGLNTHELGVYCGAVPVVLVAFLMLQWKHVRRTHLLWASGSLLILATWLSLGSAAGLYRLQLMLPLVGKFRWPSRIVVLMHLSVSILAALGINHLLTKRTAARFSKFHILWLIPVASLASSILVRFGMPGFPAASTALLVTGPVLFGLAMLMINDAARGKPAIGILLFALGDLIVYGVTYESLWNRKSLAAAMADLQVPPADPGSGRVIAEAHGSDSHLGYGGNDLVLAGWKQADGYEGLVPQMWLPEENMSVEAFRVSGVRWVVRTPAHERIPGLLPTENEHWLECPSPVPRFQLTSRYTVIHDPRSAARAVRGDGPLVLGTSPLAHDTMLTTIATVNESEIDVRQDRPGRIALQLATASAQILSVCERWSPGWTATIDGKPAEVLRCNADFMAISIPAGEHDVRLIFQSQGVREGLRTSLISMGLLVLYAGMRRSRIQRGPPPKTAA